MRLHGAFRKSLDCQWPPVAHITSSSSSSSSNVRINTVLCSAAGHNSDETQPVIELVSLLSVAWRRNSGGLTPAVQRANPCWRSQTTHVIVLQPPPPAPPGRSPRDCQLICNDTYVDQCGGHDPTLTCMRVISRLRDALVWQQTRLTAHSSINTLCSQSVSQSVEFDDHGAI